MVKRVSSRKRRISRALIHPRPKGSDGMNITGRDRIHERRIVTPRSIRSYIMQYNMLEIELLRVLVRFGGLDHQLRVVTDDLVHHNADLTQMSVAIRTLPPHLARRNVDSHTCHVHG